MEIVNVFDVEIPAQADASRPDGFGREHLQLGGLLGAALMGATLYEVLPGQRIGPYHYEYNNEEWLFVVDGRPTLRTPGGERELRPGDLVAFPEGAVGAHDTSNRTDEPVRVLIVSTKRSPAVAVYPDSDKLAIWRFADGDTDSIIVRRSDATDYWDGEAG